MLTIKDCIALSDLTEAEVDAIAEHEHLPEMVAVEMGHCLAHCPGGPDRIAHIMFLSFRMCRFYPGGAPYG